MRRPLAAERRKCGAILAPSLRGLAKIGSSQPIFDWGSVLLSLRHSLRHAVRRATSLKEGGEAAAPLSKINNNLSYHILSQSAGLDKAAMP